MSKRFYAIAFIVVLVVSACKREPISWDNRVAAPLFSTQFRLGDINNANLQPNLIDSSYRLVYENLVYSYRMENVRAYDTGLSVFFTLNRLKLNDQKINRAITLGEINPIFKLLDGQTALVPAQNQQNLSPVQIDASAFFETATLDSGYMDISLTNSLPVRVKLLVFELLNAEDNSVVALDSFRDIDTGTTATRRIDLANKTVSKNLLGSIKLLQTEASNGPVLIEANKGVNVELAVTRLRPRRAIAAFPSQTVISQDEGLTVFMGGADVKYFKTKRGRLRINLVSTIEEDMTMFFKIPSASKDGKVLESTVKLPGAAKGSVSTRFEDFDLTDYLIDFRGKNPDVKDTVNTFHQILLVTLDSSGRKVEVGLNDSIRIEYRMEGMYPDYAIGYLGNSVVQTGPQKVPFSLFKGVNSDLKLKDFKVSLILKNSIGADGRLRLNQLKGENVFSQKVEPLRADVLGQDLFVTSPPFKRDAYTVTEVVLDSSNSNIRTFIENLPQLLHYDLDLETSPNGNVNNWQDFVFDNSKVDVILKVEAPAELSFSELVLRDTQSLDLSNLGDLSRVKSALMRVKADNGFPYGAQLQLSLLDANMVKLENLDISSETNRIEPGIVLPDGTPVESVESQLELALPRRKISVLQQAKFIAIEAKLISDGQMKSLNSAYGLQLATTLDCEYEVRVGGK